MIFSDAKVQNQKAQKHDNCYPTIFLSNRVQKQNMFIFAPKQTNL